MNNPLIQIGHFEAEMIILGPRHDMNVMVQLERFACLPCTIVDTEVDLRLSRWVTWFSRVPRRHVGRRAQRMLWWIEDRDDILGVLEANRLPDMIDYQAHIDRQKDAPVDVAGLEQVRLEDDAVRVEESLDDANDLCQQVLLATAPVVGS